MSPRNRRKRLANDRVEPKKSGQLFMCVHTTKRFPSSRCASAIQIVRPLQSIAETQPELVKPKKKSLAIFDAVRVEGICSLERSEREGPD
jgi:hypothetical protein